MDENKRHLVTQMKAKIARLERERLGITGRYIGMLIEYGKTSAWRARLKTLDRKIHDLRERLLRLEE